MFKKLVDDEGGRVTFRFDDREITAAVGETVAAALLLAGKNHLRTTAGGAPRGPYCLMGSCYECLVTVDGVNRQACQLIVQQDMVITRLASLTVAVVPADD